MSAERNRTAVSTADGQVRLTTPEGQEIDLAPERARELVSSSDLHRRIRRCLHQLPIQFQISERNES
jgi:hypothetical protein